VTRFVVPWSGMILALVTLFVPVPASAQEPKAVFNTQWWNGVQEGDKLVVTNADGTRRQGRVLRAGPNEVVLESDSSPRGIALPADRVRQVEVLGRSRAKVGALIGLAGGAAGGYAAAASGGESLISGTAFNALSAAVFGSIGALVGAGVGSGFHAKGRVLYSAPGASPTVGVSLTLLISRRVQGVACRVAF